MASWLDTILQNLQTGLAGHWDLFFGAIAVVIYAWSLFNNWTDKEVDVRRESPPSHFTTKGRFFPFRALYVISYVAFFAALPAAPGFFQELFSAVGIEIKVGGEGSAELPVWSAIFLMVIIPQTPILKNLDHSFRHYLHRAAHVPVKANSMVTLLNNKIARFSLTNEEIAKFLEDNADENLPVTAADFDSPPRNVSRVLSKLLYLDYRIQQWMEEPRVAAVFAGRKKSYEQFTDAIAAIRNTAIQFQTAKQQSDELNSEASDDTPSQFYMDSMKRDLTARVNRRLVQAYEFIAQGIHATERTQFQINQRLKWFGFQMDDNKLQAQAIGPVIVVLGIIWSGSFMASFIPIVLAQLFPNSVAFSLFQGEPATIALTMSLIITLFFGQAIIVASHLTRILDADNTERRFVSVQHYLKQASKEHYMVAAFIGALTGFLTLAIVPMLFIDNLSFGLAAKSYWPWCLLSALTCWAVTRYICAAKTSVSRYKYALRQTILTAALSSIPVINGMLTPSFINLQDSLLLAVIATISGGLMGFFFSKEYREHWKRWKENSSDRAYERQRFYSDIELSFEDDDTIESYATENASACGLKINEAIPDSTGLRVHIRVPNFGELEGEVHCVLNDSTIIKYNLDKSQARRFENFLRKNQISDLRMA